MSNRNRIMLFILFVVAGTFNFGQTVYAESEVKWPIAINESNFPDTFFRNYLLDQDFGKDAILTKDEMKKVKVLSLSYMHIFSLEGIQYFQMLEELYSHVDGITSLDVSQNIMLTELHCDNMNLTSLDLGNNNNLKILSCRNTNITNLDISKNTELINLYCDDINISSLDLSNNKELTTLSCMNTKISSLDLSNNKELNYLSCVNTNISSLDLSNNKELTTLRCMNTKISSLDISNLTELVELNCEGTSVGNLDISNNELLSNINCSNTVIDSLDVSNQQWLGTLNCSNTNISSLDVSYNSRLTTLNCSDTDICSLDISNHTRLVNLDCHNTDISSLELYNKHCLQNLYCDNTRISSLELSDVVKLVDYRFFNCETPVRLSSGNIIDLSQLSGFNTSKVGNVQNATLSDNKLLVKNPDEIISYAYDCGGGYMEMFNLVVCWCEINYELNGGILMVENPNQYQAGDKLTLTSPERNGYTFAGWYKEDTFLTQVSEKLNTAGMSGPFTLYAKWEPILEETTYAVTFDANGGTGQMARGEAAKGKAFILPQNGFTAPSGRRFKEWAIGSASGAKVKAGGTFIFTETATVYAVWEPIPEKLPTYAITYHANGGTGQMTRGSATKGKVFALPKNGFQAPSGKRFKEWAVGSTGGKRVKAGGVYTFTKATTVYAVWEAIPAKVTEVKEAKKASFKELQLKAKASKTSNRLTWKKVNGADGYLVYGAKRGKKLTELKAVTKGVGYTHKKLSKKTFYQYRVKAYRLINGEKKVISVSQNIYSVTNGGRYDNQQY